MVNECGTAHALDAQDLLKEVRVHAALLSSKLNMFARQYGESSPSNATLHQENRLLRQQLQQLKHSSRRSMEQLPLNCDRLAAMAPSRCLQEVVQHGAPTPDRYKEPPLLSLIDDSKAPSPKELWNAEPCDSEADFKSRMPRGPRWSKASLNGEVADSNAEAAKLLGEDNLSGKRESSSRCSSSEREVGDARPARDTSSSIDATEVGATALGVSSLGLRLSAAASTACPVLPNPEAEHQEPNRSVVNNHTHICRSSEATAGALSPSVGSGGSRQVVHDIGDTALSNEADQEEVCAARPSRHSTSGNAQDPRVVLGELPPVPLPASPEPPSNNRQDEELPSSADYQSQGNSESDYLFFQTLPVEKGPEPVQALALPAEKGLESVQALFSMQTGSERQHSQLLESSNVQGLCPSPTVLKKGLSFAANSPGEGSQGTPTERDSMIFHTASSMYGSQPSSPSNATSTFASQAEDRQSRIGAASKLCRGKTCDPTARRTGLQGMMANVDSDLVQGDPFERWALWRSASENFVELSSSRTHGTVAQSFMKMSDKSDSRIIPSDRCEERMACMMVHPRHPRIAIWHLLGSVLIIYDVFMIPIDCFGLPDSSFNVALAWSGTCYWSGDFLLAFFLGYENELGQIELRPKAVAWHYFRTFFWMDAIIVAFDWVSFLVLNMGGSSRATRMKRAFRLARFLRVLRILKLANMVGRCLDRVNSEEVLIGAKIFLLTIVIFFFNHYLGCYWYFVAAELSSSPTTWLTATQSGKDFDFQRLYVISVLWSFAQSGFVSTDIYPTNMMEYVYVFVVGFLWLLLLAATISKVTQWLLQLSDAKHEIAMQETMIRKYLRDNCVSTDICEEVVRYCRKFWRSRARRVHTTDIVIFEDLPMRLRVSIQRQVFMPILISHPLFEEFHKVNEKALTAVCHLAMSEHYYQAGSDIFGPEDEATQMFFVLSGELEYFTVKNNFEPTTITVAEWILEAVLWRHWVCRGRLVAKSSSELVSIDANKFQAVIAEGEDKGWDVGLLRHYADCAVAHYGRVDPNNDIWDQGDYIPELVHEAWEKTFGDNNQAMNHKQSLSGNLSKKMRNSANTTNLSTMRKHLKQRLITDR